MRYAKRLPLNPTAEISRKGSNQRLNGERKRDLDIAKGAKKEGYVPSNLRQNSPESISSIGRKSLDPECQQLGRQVSIAEPEHQRIRADQHFNEDYDFFHPKHDPASFASIREYRQSDQNLMMDNLQLLAQNEIESGTDVSEIFQQPNTKIDSMLGSHFTFRSQQEGCEQLSDHSAAQRPLPAGNTQQWSEDTTTFSNPENQQAMMEKLEPEHFKSSQADSASNQEWIGHAKFPNETAVVDNTFQQQLSDYPSMQDQDMQGAFLYQDTINLPLNNEEVDKLLRISKVFDPELGVWRDGNGEIMDFGSLR